MKNTSLVTFLLIGFLSIASVITANSKSECTPGADEKCGLHKICLKNNTGTNTVKSTYHCTCKPGYEAAGDSCKAKHDCTPKTADEKCGEHKQCVKKSNAYRCVCKQGFTSIGDSCKDVDECKYKETRVNCKQKGAKCENLPGSYECKCPSGFEMHPTKYHCDDYDECEDEPCHERAVCHNKRGSYNCECAKGFAGDGRECVEDKAYKQKQKIQQFTIIGGAAGGCVLLIVVLIGCYCARRRNTKEDVEETIERQDSTLTDWVSSEDSDDDED